MSIKKNYTRRIIKIRFAENIFRNYHWRLRHILKKQKFLMNMLFNNSFYCTFLVCLYKLIHYKFVYLNHVCMLISQCILISSCTKSSIGMKIISIEFHKRILRVNTLGQDENVSARHDNLPP